MNENKKTKSKIDWTRRPGWLLLEPVLLKKQPGDKLTADEITSVTSTKDWMLYDSHIRRHFLSRQLSVRKRGEEYVIDTPAEQFEAALDHGTKAQNQLKKKLVKLTGIPRHLLGDREARVADAETRATIGHLDGMERERKETKLILSAGTPLPRLAPPKIT